MALQTNAKCFIQHPSVDLDLDHSIYISDPGTLHFQYSNLRKFVAGTSGPIVDPRHFVQYNFGEALLCVDEVVSVDKIKYP